MPTELRTYEWIAFGYFAYLAAAAALKRLPGWQKRRVLATCLLIDASIVVLAPQDGRIAAAVRDWIPLILVVAGYWLPALLVTAPKPALEERLLRFDRRLFGDRGLATFVERAPRWLVDLLELAYLFCYPLVPLGFAWLVLAGFHEQTDRFWTAVLLAAFGCYGWLPWLPTRAPRAIEGEPVRQSSSIRRLNLRVLARASVQLNTFPSGHTAASLATALAVGAYVPYAGVVLGVIALGIAVGSVVGRYHYAADAVAGAVVALAALAAAQLL